MLTSEALTELKYQEILAYQDLVTNAAINGNVTGAVNLGLGCLLTALITSLIMNCCAMVLMPNQNQKNQR